MTPSFWKQTARVGSSSYSRAEGLWDSGTDTTGQERRSNERRTSPRLRTGGGMLECCLRAWVCSVISGQCFPGRDLKVTVVLSQGPWRCVSPCPPRESPMSYRTGRTPSRFLLGTRRPKRWEQALFVFPEKLPLVRRAELSSTPHDYKSTPSQPAGRHSPHF